jgi:prepilin-type N-terminal cleavage/methylation domain-containing protein
MRRQFSIFHFPFSSEKQGKSCNFCFVFQYGFTLVELLAVMAVFLTVIGIVLGTLFVSLRGSKKSDVILAARHNGDGAMEQMVRRIRYAKSLDSPNACIPEKTSLNSLTITSSDGMQTVFSCPATSGEGISSNSASLIDTSAVSVSACSFSCSQLSPSDPPKITITFTLSSVGGGNFVEGKTSVPFQTSVTMRNYTYIQ